MTGELVYTHQWLVIVHFVISCKMSWHFLPNDCEIFWWHQKHSIWQTSFAQHATYLLLTYAQRTESAGQVAYTISFCNKESWKYMQCCWQYFLQFVTMYVCVDGVHCLIGWWQSTN
jgi:hypothetical protein